MSYPVERNHGCRLTMDGTLKGLRTVVLENQKLRVTVLLDKGTDIWEFLYKPLDLDFMWRSPMLLREPKSFVPSSSTSLGLWYDYYEGGWQDIAPSGGPSSRYKGAEFGLHGETSTIPWECRVVENAPERISVVFWTRLYRSPFYFEKTLSLLANEAVLHVEESVENEGEEEMRLMWGHHPALGGNFLDENCVIDTDARRVQVHPDVVFNRQRFTPGDSFDWPTGKGKDGKPIDVSRMPAPSSGTADLLYLTGFEKGWYAITNLRRGIGFAMAWQKEVFPYVWLWQVCHGSEGYPWYGRTYNMALEPWTSCPGSGIAEAVAAGTALRLEPGQKVDVEMKAIVYAGSGRVTGIHPDGQVDNGEGRSSR
jgi:hypothetical protein